MKLTKDQIDRISQELDCGMKCYINKETGEIKAILDRDDFYGDSDFVEEALKEIEESWNDYIVIEKMSSREAFQVMESFIDLVNDDEIQKRLIYALNGRHPFRNFKNEVDYNEEIRQMWFAHKAKKYKKYVREYIALELDLPIEIEDEIIDIPIPMSNLNGAPSKPAISGSKSKAEKTIQLTDKQYKQLVKLLFYGEWILNANKIKDYDEDARKFVEHIFSLKEKFNLKAWFRELKFGGEELTDERTQLLLDKIWEYNEETFWFYLSSKLAEREAEKECEENGGDGTYDFDKLEELTFKYQERYTKAFKNGAFKNLILKNNGK